MDVRCEKCQTEYELDESRLKPGGVTVKCTNCGNTFRVRKRTPTNVGAPATPLKPAGPPAPVIVPVPQHRAASDDSAIFEDERTGERLAHNALDEAPTTVDRQWLIRLENGEQKSCRELATLQQWIITGVVTRESLISRTGKTWKRLGDVADLGQYFTIADEARVNRERSKPTPRPAPSPSGGGGPIKEVPGTIPGYSAAAYAPQAAGGTILPDDDEPRTTRAFRGAPTPPPVPPRGAIRTPALGAPVPQHAPAPPQAAVQAASETVPSTGHAIPRRPPTQPPPPPKRASSGQSGPVPQVPASSRPAPPATPPPPIPQGSRATAMWANDAVKPGHKASSTAPFIGKLSAIPDEPAFAGKVRMAPGAESSFESGRVMLEDDDDVLPVRRGGRTGMIVLVMALLVMGGAAAVVYMFVIRGGKEPAVATSARDAGVEVVAQDAIAVVITPPDAVAVADTASLDGAHGELRADVEPRLRTAMQGLDGKTDAPSQAMRAYLTVQLAQDLIDRASLLADKPVAEGLRKDAKQLVLDAASAAQRALKTAGDDAGANLTMAEVLRLQGKPAREARHYLDTARSKADKDWTRELALAEALQQVHDGKLDDAKASLTAIDQGDGKLETSGDVRARFHLALVLAAQNKPADARPLADSILAAQPEHAGAKALLAKLETNVATSDPLPPEEGSNPGPANPGPANPGPANPGPANPGHDPRPAGKEPRPTGASPGPTTSPSPGPTTSPSGGGGGGSYDTLITSANKAAESSCARAIELYNKALEQKPNGVEALTGLGYCYIDAKQFSSAFSKFRTALAMSSRYEPALRGIAEGYLQQGRKDLAIEAYKHYLEVYPDNAIAKKQLDRLGGGPDQPAPAPPSTPTTPTTSKTPSPGPTTTPDSPAGGSASE